MPAVDVVFFKDENGTVPVIEFLQECSQRDIRIPAKFQVSIERLEQLGWELTRPEADTLRDGIHELRVKFGTVNYRILYSFHRGAGAMALLSHGLTKEKAVPPADIDLAIRRKAMFEADPTKHTFVPDDDETDDVDDTEETGEGAGGVDGLQAPPVTEAGPAAEAPPQGRARKRGKKK